MNADTLARLALVTGQTPAEVMKAMAKRRRAGKNEYGEEEKERIRQMVRDGWYASDMAKALGITGENMHGRLRRLGLKARYDDRFFKQPQTHGMPTFFRPRPGATPDYSGENVILAERNPIQRFSRWEHEPTGVSSLLRGQV